MDKGVGGRDIEAFYHLSRAVLVKDEKHYDRFDQVFGKVFKGLEGVSPGEEITADIPEDWLRLLGHLPADLMRLGVDRYLLSKNRHKPTPGTFLELVEKDLSLRRTLARRAQETLLLLDGRVAA